MNQKPKRTTRPAGTIKPLAAKLEVSTRRIGQLLAAGMPDDPEAALEWKRQHESGDGSAEALRKERILLVRAQRAKLDLETSIRRAELVPVGEVRQSMFRVCSAARGEFLKLPNDLPPRLEGLPAAKIQAILRSEVIAILTRLSDETSALYAEE